MPRALVITVLLCTLTIAPAAADLTLKATAKGSGIAAMGSGETVTYIQANKMRSDWSREGKSFSTILDLDARKMIVINHQKKLAEAHDLAEVAQSMQEIPVGDIRVEMEPTGGSRTILGKDCAEYRLRISVLASPVPDQPMEVVMSGPVWIADGAPGEDDYRRFYLAAAENGLILSDPDAAKAQPGQARGMTEMYRKMAEAGVAYATEIAVGFEGSGLMATMMNKMGGTTIASEVTFSSTDPLPPDTFGIPTGYKTKGQ